MKNFTQTLVACFSAFILLFVAGCSDSPTAPEHTTLVTLRFTTPSADEIVGPNEVAITLTNVANNHAYSMNLNSPKALIYPDRTFYVLEGALELPTGAIGEKVEYRMNAIYEGVGDSPRAPSRDVSHMVTVNNVTLFYGDENGMRFAIACDGEIETIFDNNPDAPMHASRPYFGVSTSWPPIGISGTINVTIENLTVNSLGEPLWRPIFTSYDWSTSGMLPTYRFAKVVAQDGGWSTNAELPPVTGDQFVRVKVTLEGHVITDQVSIGASGFEWPSENSDGWRVYRLSPGGYGGKG